MVTTYLDLGLMKAKLYHASNDSMCTVFCERTKKFLKKKAESLEIQA